MAGTNGFNPAGFYGVAFDHLENATTLAVVEPKDVLTSSGWLAAWLALAITDQSDTLAAISKIIAFATLATSDSPDVLAAGVTSITHASLSVTEGTFDVLTASAFVAHLPVVDLVEPKDIVVVELITTADSDLALTEDNDTLTCSLSVFIEAYLHAVEDPDTVEMAIGRWSFFYIDSEEIRVPWENQYLYVEGEPQNVVPPEYAPPDPGDGTFFEAHFEADAFQTGPAEVTTEDPYHFEFEAFEDNAFYSGEINVVVPSPPLIPDYEYDNILIRVPWEVQHLSVIGTMKGPANRYHTNITAFLPAGFDFYGFFSGSGGSAYEDNEALVVQAEDRVVERLRQDRRSYAVPRMRGVHWSQASDGGGTEPEPPVPPVPGAFEKTPYYPTVFST